MLQGSDQCCSTRRSTCNCFHYLQGVLHPKLCRISSIDSIWGCIDMILRHFAVIPCVLWWCSGSYIYISVFFKNIYILIIANCGLFSLFKHLGKESKNPVSRWSISLSHYFPCAFFTSQFLITGFLKDRNGHAQLRSGCESLLVLCGPSFLSRSLVKPTCGRRTGGYPNRFGGVVLNTQWELM